MHPIFNPMTEAVMRSRSQSMWLAVNATYCHFAIRPTVNVIFNINREPFVTNKFACLLKRYVCTCLPYRSKPWHAASFSRTDTVPYMYFICTLYIVVYFASHFNSLRPSRAMWRHRTWSTLVQVMDYCQAAPSYYIIQCWLILCEVFHLALIWGQVHRICLRYLFLLWCYACESD